MANKSTSGRTAGKNKLQIHLLIGFLMTIVAIFGYSYFGPGARAANKMDLRQDHLTINADAVAPAAPDTNVVVQASDYTELQAEMDEFQRRVGSLNTGNVPMKTLPATQANIPASSSGPVQNQEKIVSLLDQMIAMLNDLTAGSGAQTGAAATPGVGTGQ